MGVIHKLFYWSKLQLRSQRSPLDNARDVEPSPGQVTRLLLAVRTGDSEAENELLTLLHAELRRLAASYLRRERPDHTLSPTALVHEAYIRMAADGEGLNLENRAHFFGIAARVMRRILVDHARAHNSAKRGSGREKLLMNDEMLAGEPRGEAQAVDLLMIDEALTRLAAVDARQARVVELRFFADLSIDETAKVLGCSSRMVNRDWRMAQAWLRRELTA